MNILLVDDEVRNLDVLESILEAPGYHLRRVQTAQEALMALIEGEFAAIVLDIQMPGTNGIELAHLIKQRKRTQHIPIIFLTAYFQDDKDVLQGYEVGAVDYLTKPVNPRILKSKIAVFAELFRKSRELAVLNGIMEGEIAQRQRAEEALRRVNTDLEVRVQQRTVELSRANDDLQASERRLTTTLSRMPASVYTCDAQGRVTFYNEAAVELWGREPQLGKDLWCGSYRIYRPDGTTLPLDQCPMAVTLSEGRAVRGEEIVIERPDGTRRNVLPYPEPILDASGALVGAINMLVDITDRKRFEQDLERARDLAEQASRAKDDFLAALSHELRTPLNPVLLLASDAANDSTLPESVRLDFETIAKNVSLEARLIDDLLDLTRITRGKLALDLRIIEAREILNDAVATVQTEMERKQISLVVDLDEAEQFINGDRARLTQVFWNLLKNAVKFTPEKGRIILKTRKLVAEDRLVVSVSDTGIGMTPDEIHRVFDAFSQGEHATDGVSHRFGGLGLGLAISRKLVELHSGSICASSDGRNHGTTFSIGIPLTHPPKADPTRTPPDAFTPGITASSRKQARLIRILLVEDHEPTRATLAQLLTRRHYQVETAGSLAEARLLASKQDFHLLISDIGLPDGEGYDLMMELGKQQQLKGIALTGYGMEQDIARSQSAGFIAHLTKPVRVQSLEAALAVAVQ